ncbi:MAG: tetratricopeptide repeat protein, partial [Acidobacteriota bacterium]
MRIFAKILLLLLAAPLPLPAQSRGEYAGKVLSVQNRVEVQEAAWVPAVVDQELYAVTALRTFAKSRAVVLLADETQLKIHSDSFLQLKAVRRSSTLLKRLQGLGPGPAESDLNLSVGEVWMRSKKKPSSMKIQTPSVTAAIRGTEINLRVAPDGESVITVLEGAAEFSNPQGRIVVNAGEQGRARPGQAPTKTVLANPDNAVQWTFYYSAAVSPRDYPFSATPSQTAGSDALAQARRHFDAGQLEKALQSLSSLSGTEASQVRGWVYLAQNRIDEAIQELGQGLADSPRTRLGLSLSHYRTGDWERAYSYVESPGSEGALRLQKALLDLVSGDVQSSRQLLESLPPGDAFYALAQGLLSDVLLVQNDRENALRAATRAIRANPDSPSAQLNLSRVQQSLFDLPEARRSAERALQLDPGFLQARLQLAGLLFGEGRTNRAEKLVQQALQEAPLEAEAHSMLGFILLARGKTPQARQSFQKAIQLDSSLSRPRLGLGLAEMRRGDDIEAALRIMEAATLDPRISLYQSYLAKAFYEQREFEQAFFALDTAQQLDPRDPTPHLYEGIFQEDLNRPGIAVGAFRDSVRLNDNRAVYRSRLLLDQDRSTRNVQLATAYNRLGLTDWANSSAIRSSLDDPSNSSARLFLAGTFLNLKGRTVDAGSELLWVRLLQPANANSFNTFNDYTTLFESPRMDWSAEGLYGSFDTAQATLISSGGTARFAYQSAFTYDRSAGFRPVNDFLQSYTGIAFFKFALTPESDFFVSYTHDQSIQGDPGTSPLVNDANDPNLRVFTRTNRVEVGYHHRLSPRSEVVLLFSGRQVEQVIDDPDFEHVPVLFTPGFDRARRRSERRPNLNFQAAHLLNFERLRIRYGVDFFEGRTRTRDLFSGEDARDPPRAFLFEGAVLRRKNRFKTIFLQGDYEIAPRLTLTAGLNYEWSNDDNAFDSQQRSTSRWNPQGGL